jgi:hypothetical protein
MTKDNLFILFILSTQFIIGCGSPTNEIAKPTKTSPPIKEIVKSTKTPLPIKGIVKSTKDVSLNDDKKRLERKASKFTVKIIAKAGSKSDTGTGYIFKHDNGVYSVVTVGHNVKLNESGADMEVSQPTEAENKSKDTIPTKIQLITSDNKTYDISTKNIFQPNESLDIAILKFESNISYFEALLGEEDRNDNGSTIYLIGHKGCVDEKANDLELTAGKIIANPNNQNDIHYTNATVTGMSGSPIMNNKGEIIGIHAYSSKQKDTIESDIKDGCKKIDGNINLGNNYGIPLQKFRKYLQH